MLDGKPTQHRVATFARLKRHDRACVTSIDDRLCGTLSAPDFDCFTLIVNVLEVSAGRYQDNIAVIRNVDRLLNRWLIRRNMDYASLGRFREQ